MTLNIKPIRWLPWLTRQERDPETLSSVEPTSLADLVFPPAPTSAERWDWLQFRAQLAWQRGLAAPAAAFETLRMPQPRMLWWRAGKQAVRSNAHDLAYSLKVTQWTSDKLERLFVRSMRWGWHRRDSQLTGFVWRATRKTMRAEWAATRTSFKVFAATFRFWRRAAAKAAWLESRQWLSRQ